MDQFSCPGANTIYSVNAFYNGEFMFQTDFSNSKTRMKRLLEKCSTMDLSKLEFQMYRSTPKGPVYVNNSSMKTLSDMTLENWKGGLLLRPMDDDERWGQKYFMNGWWMPKHESWFFKMDEFDKLIEAGAEYISDVVQIDEDETDSDMHELGGGDDYNDDYDYDDDHGEDHNDEYVDLTSLDIEPYGEGYLVRAPKDHKHYGNKYYGGGWWNNQQQGWFFKKEQYSKLVEYGAVEYKPTIIESVEPYGRGYILKPCISHPQYGSKYYRNGWWNNSSSGWFFKKEFVDEETMTVI